jgi:acyl-CoA synthetase (AMP-forming)/AMP-acid ligase II
MMSKEFQRFPEQETAQTIPQRFSQQVARFPDSTAVRTLSHSLSYLDLDRLSNQVANAVLRQFPGASKTVALLFEQGVNSIIAILGVLKAGKIYVSLAPYSEVADLQRIIQDCGPGLLITTEKHQGLASQIHRPHQSIYRPIAPPTSSTHRARRVGPKALSIATAMCSITFYAIPIICKSTATIICR